MSVGSEVSGTLRSIFQGSLSSRTRPEILEFYAYDMCSNFQMFDVVSYRKATIINFIHVSSSATVTVATNVAGLLRQLDFLGAEIFRRVPARMVAQVADIR